jgi:hypothetical protein
MARQRLHWIDNIANDLQERIKQAIPAVANSLKDSVPVGYKPPKTTVDVVDQFLAMDGDQRLQQYQQMGPEAYKEYSTTLMQAMSKRYGAAAQALMPLLESTEAQAMMAPGADQQQGAVDPMTMARMELAQYLGVDPLGENSYGT